MDLRLRRQADGIAKEDVAVGGVVAAFTALLQEQGGELGLCLGGFRVVEILLEDVEDEGEGFLLGRLVRNGYLLGGPTRNQHVGTGEQTEPRRRDRKHAADQ